MNGLPDDMTMNDDRLLPSILIQGMDSGLRFRDDLQVAEADVRRLKNELAVAEMRVEVVSERYKANETFVRDVWGTLKEGWLATKHPAADKPELKPVVHP